MGLSSQLRRVPVGSLIETRGCQAAYSNYWYCRMRQFVTAGSVPEDALPSPFQTLTTIPNHATLLRVSL